MAVTFRAIDQKASCVYNVSEDSSSSSDSGEEEFIPNPKIKKNQVVMLALSMSGLLISIIEHEDNFSSTSSKFRNQSSPQGNFLRSIVCLSTFFLAYLLVLDSWLQYKNQYRKLEGEILLVPSFWKSSYFRNLLAELLVTSVHCPPFVDTEFEFEQLSGKLVVSLNGVCLSVMLLRVYLVFPVLSKFTKWGNERAQATCRTCGFNFRSLFALKALLKERPLEVLAFSMLGSIIVFAVGIRVYERPYELLNTEEDNFKYIWNGMWLVVLTMTTVGYGDVYPKTHVGRFIGALSCLFGVFLVSLVVVSLSNAVKFKKGESRAFMYLQKLESYRNYVKFAKLSVKSALVCNLACNKSSESNVFYEKKKLQKNLEQFWYWKQVWKRADFVPEEFLLNINERLLYYFEVIQSNIKLADELDQQLDELLSSQKAAIKFLSVK